jgi:hypothetical protein
MSTALAGAKRGERDLSELYAQTCVKHNVCMNSAVSKFLRMEGQNAQILDMRLNYIGNRGAVVFCGTMLRQLPRLHTLNIAYNGLRDQAIVTLCQHITTPSCHPGLSYLDLSGNEINNEPGGKAVLNMVSENHLIVDLRIDNTRICSKTKEHILTTVHHNNQNCAKNVRKHAYEGDTAAAAAAPKKAGHHHHGAAHRAAAGANARGGDTS